MIQLFKKISYIIIILIFTGFSCVNNNQDHTVDNDKNLALPKKLTIISPIKNQEIKDNDKIVLKVVLTDTLVPDSIQFLIDGQKIGKIVNYKDSLIYGMQNTKLGSRTIDAVGFFPGGEKDHDYLQVKVLLSKAPIAYSYNIIHTYPHDKNAYTQGLIFENDHFIEGTGQYKQSSLRKVNFLNGEVTKLLDLPSDIFGEGVTTFDNKIIQISWKEQTAFLYDKETFQLLNKYFYPIKEGWGITYDGKNLIMSDGSSILYFLDKEYFTEVSRIQVFDENGPLDQLNELEYIKGEIWANVYTKDIIVRINPKTGAVIGRIDMTGLLKSQDRSVNTDVLNGIAYDSKNDRIFVTGKNWPKLFEVTIFPKK